MKLKQLIRGDASKGGMAVGGAGTRAAYLPYRLGFAGLLLLFAWYLFAAHYVQDYSDPVGFLGRALAWAQGVDGADRAPLYPAMLYQFLRVLGREWVFLSNLPFHILMLGLLGGMVWVIRGDSRKWKVTPSEAWLGALAALVIPILARQRVLLQLVNPYRETPTFSLMLASVLFLNKAWKASDRWWWAGLSGLSLGLATSIREVSLLLLLPIGLWLLVGMATERKLRWSLLLGFGLGLLIGLAPLLYKNYAFSGQALVPAYSAGRISRYRDMGAWDIPIPGMSLRYFTRTGPATLGRLLAAYTPIGVLFFIAGVAFAWVRRQRIVLWLLLPATLCYLFFFSFYNRYLPRYVMTVEIFALPIMACGFAGCSQWLAARLPRRRPARGTILRYALAGCGLLWVGARLLPAGLRADGRTKVWHLRTLRSELAAAIETPAIFMGGRHFCFRMEWLLDQDSHEYALTFERDYDPDQKLTERFRRQGTRTLKQFAHGNYYINESNFSLASQWLQREPVLAFADLSVPFERYGRPEPGHLYRVQLWQQDRITLEGDAPRPARALLMLDLKRPWDYPTRTYLTGREPEGLAVHSLTNGVQFIPLPEHVSAEPFRFTIESDQPLPPDPFWRVIGQDEDLRLSFGLGAEMWAWNFVSANLYPNSVIPRDACQLYDQGILRAPLYASAGRDVYAELRLEFIQGHPHWHKQAHAIKVRTPQGAGRWPLPPARQLGYVVVPLGQGTGAWAERPIELSTTLPSHRTQNTEPFWSHCRQNGFVKIYSLRVFSRAAPAAYPLAVDIGASGDAYALGGGFHGRERSGAFSGRWTDGAGHIRLRAPPSETVRLLRWRLLPLRPRHAEVALVFTVNGRPIPDGQVRRSRKDGVEIYEMPVDSDLLRTGAWNDFTLETGTWKPAGGRGAQDTRTLGVFVEHLELE